MEGYQGEIGDICWVERLANMVASHMLVVCPTPFEKGHLLRLLNDGTFGQGFQCNGEFNSHTVCYPNNIRKGVVLNGSLSTLHTLFL